MAKFTQRMEVIRTIEMTVTFEAPDERTACRMMDDLASSWDEILYEELADNVGNAWPSWELNNTEDPVRLKEGQHADPIEPSIASFCEDWLADNVEEN